MLSNTKEGFKADVKNAETKVRQEGRDAIRGHEDDIVDIADRAGRKLRRYYDAATDELHDDYELVASRIRNNPVQSSLVALGIGVLLGAVLRRL